MFAINKNLNIERKIKMTVKEFINAATDTVHVMIPWPLHGEYHPRTKKTYISSIESDDDVSNSQIDFFTTEFYPEIDEIIITVYIK